MVIEILLAFTQPTLQHAETAAESEEGACNKWRSGIVIVSRRSIYVLGLKSDDLLCHFRGGGGFFS